jgi:hypothetical protein
MKQGLKLFVLLLIGLKSKDRSHYEVIRRMVVHEDSYAAILEKRHYYSNMKINETFQFYEDLRKEEKLANQMTLQAPGTDPRD